MLIKTRQHPPDPSTCLLPEEQITVTTAQCRLGKKDLSLSLYYGEEEIPFPAHDIQLGPGAAFFFWP